MRFRCVQLTAARSILCLHDASRPPSPKERGHTRQQGAPTCASATLRTLASLKPHAAASGPASAAQYTSAAATASAMADAVADAMTSTCASAISPSHAYAAALAPACARLLRHASGASATRRCTRLFRPLGGMARSTHALRVLLLFTAMSLRDAEGPATPKQGKTIMKKRKAHKKAPPMLVNQEADMLAEVAPWPSA